MIGTAARTAVVVGTANAVGRRSQERAINEQQAAAYRADQAAQDAANRAAAPPPSSGTELITQLTELARLRDAGVLTPEEFDATKAKLLAAS